MFSVVIPTCLGGPLLKRCLDSLLEHGPCHLHLIVVFDGPARYETSLPASLPKQMTLEAVCLPLAMGFCRAVNRGLERADSGVVQLLNDDAYVLPGWYAKPLELLKRPDIAAVAPLILRDLPGQTIVDSAGDSMNPLGIIRKRYHEQDRARVEASSTEVLACGGCAGFFRTETLRTVGGFPEDFGAYFDDVEVSLTLRRLGYQILFEPDSVVIHSGGSSYGPARGALLTQQSRNEELVFWRNVPAPLLFFMAIPRFWLLGAKALVHLIRGSLPAWLIGKWQAAASLRRELHRARLRERDDRARVAAWRHWPWLA